MNIINTQFVQGLHDSFMNIHFSFSISVGVDHYQVFKYIYYLGSITTYICILLYVRKIFIYCCAACFSFVHNKGCTFT